MPVRARSLAAGKAVDNRLDTTSRCTMAWMRVTGAPLSEPEPREAAPTLAELSAAACSSEGCASRRAGLAGAGASPARKRRLPERAARSRSLVCSSPSSAVSAARGSGTMPLNSSCVCQRTAPSSRSKAGPSPSSRGALEAAAKDCSPPRASSAALFRAESAPGSAASAKSWSFRWPAGALCPLMRIDSFSRALATAADSRAGERSLRRAAPGAAFTRLSPNSAAWATALSTSSAVAPDSSGASELASSGAREATRSLADCRRCWMAASALSRRCFAAGAGFSLRKGYHCRPSRSGAACQLPAAAPPASPGEWDESAARPAAWCVAVATRPATPTAELLVNGWSDQATAASGTTRKLPTGQPHRWPPSASSAMRWPSNT
mmetsp:Transcript_15959/g.60372  ORF Transcript_15959/g.60372 Transcript_15959/m.60372 type:complete len:379 (-) Transcript_15959:951-2087(-)